MTCHKRKKKNPSREEGPEIPRETSLFQCCYQFIWRCAHITNRTIKLHNRKIKLWHFSSLFSSICFKWVKKVYFKICQCDTQGLMSDLQRIFCFTHTELMQFCYNLCLFLSKRKKPKKPKGNKTCRKHKVPVAKSNLSKTKVTTNGLFLTYSLMSVQSEAAGRGIIFKLHILLLSCPRL